MAEIKYLPLKALKETFMRFPAALICSTVSAILLIIANNLPAYPDARELAIRLALTAALGFVLFLCCALLLISAKKPSLRLRLGLHLLAAAALAAYYFVFLQQAGFVEATRYAAVTLALYLIFAVAPYAYYGRNFELHIIRLILRAVVTALYSGVLFAGLAAILAAVQTLLEVPVQDNLYLDFFIIVAGIFAPVFLLSGLAWDPAQTEEKSYPQIVDALLKNILAPLAVAYTVVLYAYLARILITRVWPEGIVAHMVLWFALLVILLIFFIAPGAGAGKWTKRFVLWMPGFMLPPLVVMFVSLGIRIQAYGFTENRYFALLLGIWAAMHMLGFILLPRMKSYILPLTLAAFSLFAVFGPLSAYNVSIRSQHGRLIAILDQYEMRENGRIIASDALEMQDKQAISSILRYFEQNHGFEHIPYLPQGFAIDDMEKTLGFAYIPATQAAPAGEPFAYQLDAQAPIDIAGYDNMFFFRGGTQQKRIGGLRVDYSQENALVTVFQDENKVYERMLSHFAEMIHERNEGITTDRMPLSAMTFSESAGGLDLKIIVYNLHGTVTDDRFDVHWAEFFILVR